VGSAGDVVIIEVDGMPLGATQMSYRFLQLARNGSQSGASAVLEECTVPIEVLVNSQPW
jgi:hypothetical protein